jgi:XTP/dITP diphosphohydrolase
MEPLYFNTVNPTKAREIKEIFKDCKREVRFLNYVVTEILSANIEEIIKAKAASAYRLAQVPVVVEHGGLYIEYLKQYPGPLSKPMWDVLEDNICDLIPPTHSRKAQAFSAVCYCDGRKRVYTVESIEGEIAQNGRGNNGFQWDHIFIPNGENKTYAEMTQTEKLQYSQAAKAYRSLRKLLRI